MREDEERPEAPDLDDPAPEPLACNRWIASSALQKAVRRGDVSIARRAVATLWRDDRRMVWRRLLVIAAEDVGVGSVAAFATTARLAADARLRREKGGDPGALDFAAALLARAPKDRSPDYLIAAAMHDPALEAAREICSRASVVRRLELVVDDSWSLTERAVAAWYGSGVESWPERRVGPGDLEGLLRVYADLGAPDELLDAVRIAVRRTREPIVVLLPLVWLALSRESSDFVDQPASAAHVDGVPLCALDLHTRLGRNAIAEFRRRSAEIAEFLDRRFSGFRAERALRYAIFFADGGLIRPRLLWKTGLQLERLGVAADFLSIGVDPGVGAELTELARRNLDELDAIRADLLARGDGAE